MYDYIYNDFKKPTFLIISFLGLINTHLITGLIVFVFCLIWVLINIKSSITNPKKVLKLIGCILLVLSLSCFFWAPMLEQLSKNTLKLSNSWTNIGEEEYSLFDYFLDQKFSIGFSIILTLPFAIYAIFIENKSKEAKKYFLCFIVISLILLCPFIWILLNKFLNIIQFKWRLLGIITTIYTIAITFIFNEHIKNYDENIVKKIILIAFSILILFSLKDFYNNGPLLLRLDEADIKEEIYLNPEALGGGEEYLPIEIEEALLIYQKAPNVAFSGSKDVVGEKMPFLAFSFNNNEIDESKISVPFIYYYGYHARLETDKGSFDIPVSKDENWLVQVEIPNNLKGDILVQYNKTTIQKVSLIISFLSVLGVLIYMFIKKKN